MVIMINQLQSIIDAFHDLLFVFNKDGVIEDYISTSHGDDLILDRETFIGKNYRDVLPPQVSKKLDQAFNKLDKGKEQYEFDYSLKLQGEKQWYAAVLSKIKSEDDPKYLGVVRNITERKNKEILLQEIFNNSPGGIGILQTIRDSNGQVTDFVITQINKSVELLTGRTEQELLGQSIAAVVSEDFKEKSLDHCKTVLDTGNPVEFQYRRRDEQGREFWFHVKLAKYRDGIIGNFLAITKQKKAEGKLAEKNEKLHDLNQQKDKLFSVLSHDLKNAIAGAKGVYDIILEDYEKLSKDEIFEYMKLLSQRTTNTHELLEDLLDWSRHQFREVTTNFEKLHLVRLTEETLNIVESHAESKKVDLVNQIPDTIYIHADTNMIKTIIRNLLTNGIKFSHPGGKIIINAEKGKDQKITVSIKDEGIGMDKETLEKVMNKNTTFTSQGTNGEKGSGVGLDLCIDFIEKNRGKIWVDSMPGEGSTFNFTLPEYSAKSS
jgi:PAS domain S-box-containing protein